ncbi:SagB family peptide dehydrogenase [Paenibacillus thiaminolyticus]|nr:SagB family peptide dehydrogenase [Paenibacillus thiaminolyticus]NGP58284.1 SagB/ThcOx family dehydrogenase [Paenibacillus thiaminolyticus]WCR26662.1 SagB family peptide dehydrogenase [Paenibacillus thiaminolyticus]
MTNSDYEIGCQFAMMHSIERYMHTYDFPSEYRVKRPLPYKNYVNTSVIRLVPLAELFREDRDRERNSLDSLLNMSRFLALCNGIIRLEVTHEWAVHRALPSARCLYPNDIYIVIPEHSFSQFPPGIYYYNPLQHCLIQVRSGDYQDEIVRQLIEQPVTKPDFIIGCASNFARTAYKYADFAYRLCTQEAGMMQGHVLQLAGEYGLEGRFHYHFCDESVHQLFGVSGVDESIMSLVTVTYSKGRTAGKRQRAVPQAERILSGALKDTGMHLDRKWFSKLIEVNQASYYQTEETVQQEVARNQGIEWSKPLMVHRLTARYDELHRALRSINWAERHSGSNVNVLASKNKLPYEALELMMEAVREWLFVARSDAEQLKQHIGIVLAVNHVAGLDAGVYWYCPDSHALGMLKHRDYALDLQQSYVQDNVNMERIQVILYPVVNYEQVLRQYGNRGYRMINMEAGTLLYRLSAVCASLGLAARCSNSINEQLTCKLLQIPQGSLPMMQILMFEDVSQLRYRYSFVGSEQLTDVRMTQEREG